MSTEIFYEKKVSCLYCEQEFKTLKVRLNRAKFIKRDSDYCPYYEAENPVFYEVNVCPNCGFAFSDGFKKIKNKFYNDITIKYINELQIVPQLNVKRNLSDALKAYKLALYTSSLAEESNLIIANLCLRIAWLYRYKKNIDEENRFLKKALNLYLEVYNTEDLNKLPMDLYMLIYLIGDLYGRLGEYDKITKWFSIIIEDKKATTKVLKLTKDRWQEYKELYFNKK